MAFRHHSESEGESPLRKLFQNEQAHQERYEEQKAGRAKRSWSDGRLGATDDGELAFRIGRHPDHELVMIDFGKPVTMVAMTPQEAVELAQELIRNARAITTTPLSIVLH